MASKLLTFFSDIFARRPVGSSDEIKICPVRYTLEKIQIQLSECVLFATSRGKMKNGFFYQFNNIFQFLLRSGCGIVVSIMALQTKGHWFVSSL